MAMASDRDQTQPSRTQQAWTMMMSEAQSKAPGIFDLLQVYGGYAQAVIQANACLSLLHIPPTVTASNRSTLQ